MNKIYNLTYKNGTRLIFQQIDELKTTSVNIFVGVGSMYEDKDNNGISHFLEHMLFKGTKKYDNANKIAKIFDKYGAVVNAFTDRDVTDYWFKSDSEYFEECFKVLSDIVVNTKINNSSIFEKEKQVVIEEINMSSDDNPPFLIEKTYDLMFEGSSISLPIGGKENTIIKFDIKNVHNYYSKYYTPNNVVISIVSNLSFNHIRKYVDDCSIVKKRCTIPYFRQLNLQILPQKNIRIKMTDRKLEQTHISFGFKTCDMYSYDVYILDIINTFLAGNMSSLFFDVLRNKHGLTYGVSTETNNLYYSGCFIIFTSVLKEKLINDGKKPGLIKVIIKLLNNLIKNGITQKQLNDIKRNLKGNKVLESEDNNNISIHNGLQIIHNYPKFISFDDDFKICTSVTLNDVNKTIRKYFKLENLSIYLLGDSNFINLTDVLNECTKLKNNY